MVAQRYPVSVAPMMDCTDRFFRYMMRQISARSLLYTEMITVEAILHGDRERFLAYDPIEHPVVIQLGGSEPQRLAEAAKIAEDWGYDEINLNVGCPSDRVQEGRFGACLMAEPALVADCIATMQSVVSVPVTVKHRIGIDHKDRWEDLLAFVEVVQQTGCPRFVVHARAAWLHGLSPKDNRNIPPLRHEEVYRLKQQYPELLIETNGGIQSIAGMRQHLEHVDGVMIGRAAYDDPYLFASVDQVFFQEDRDIPTREDVVLAMIPFLERACEKGRPLFSMIRHMLGLYRGQRGGRKWRQILSDAHLNHTMSAANLLNKALAVVEFHSHKELDTDLHTKPSHTEDWCDDCFEN